MDPEKWSSVDLSEHKVSLSTQHMAFEWDIENGSFSLLNPMGEEYLREGQFQISTKGRIINSSQLKYVSMDTLTIKNQSQADRVLILSLQDPVQSHEVRFKVIASNGLSGFTFTVQLINKSGKHLELDSISPLWTSSTILTGVDLLDLRYFQNGFHSWELSRAQPLQEGSNISHFYSVLTNRSDKSNILIGFCTMDRQLTNISFDAGRQQLERLAATCELDSTLLIPDEAVVSEELVVIIKADGLASLQEYADLAARRMNAVLCDEIPVGWCSWYFYYTMPEEGEILENTQFLKERFPDYVKWIQIDDGYQKTVGDWQPNDRFPNGLDYLKEEIEKKGFKAGIWTAPFIATEHSDLFKQHPDWFLASKKGEPKVIDDNPLWLGSYYALDLSNPAVIKHIKSLFKHLKSLGFEYFKIDFLYHATEEAKRFDETVTRAQAFRNGIEAVRESVGDSLILGCGAPLGPCIGITNAMRIGTDIATSWRLDWGGGVYECAVNTITRAPLHNRWWINDPDCLLVRQEDNELSLEEVRLWASIVALSGGAFLLSDRMMEVSEERLRLVDKLLPVYPEGALSPDTLIKPEPNIFFLPVKNKTSEWVVVGLFNLGEEPIDLEVYLTDLGLEEGVSHHVFGFWDEKYVEEVEDKISVSSLKPHTCRLYSIKPAQDRPSLLATSMHFTQGACDIQSEKWDADSNELTLVVSKATNHAEGIYFYFSEEWSIQETSVNGEIYTHNQHSPNVGSIRKRFEKDDRVKVLFSITCFLQL
ncbi:MAG: alpha-galactosidase [Candidatus Thorarchaeota archaeon]